VRHGLPQNVYVVGRGRASAEDIDELIFMIQLLANAASRIIRDGSRMNGVSKIETSENVRPFKV
jgi:hypothetical protein